MLVYIAEACTVVSVNQQQRPTGNT